MDRFRDICQKPPENARVGENNPIRKNFSPRELGEKFQYHTHLNPLIKAISGRYDTH